jgi:hypothetical protein
MGAENRTGLAPTRQRLGLRQPSGAFDRVAVRLLTSAATRGKSRRTAAFTLAEVLAAMMFMAIVIPVAMEALHIASVSGEVAVRKAEASRVADRVLNENIVTTNRTQYATGTVSENGREFRWTLRNEYWPSESAMQLLTAEVEFTAQGRTYAVRMNTLANAQSSGATMGLP